MLATYAVINNLALEQRVKWPCSQLSHGPNIFIHYCVLSIYVLMSLCLYSNYSKF